MKKIRKSSINLNLPTLHLEGGLFLPDMFEKAVLGKANFQTDEEYCLARGLKQKDEYSRAFQIAAAQWKYFEKQMLRTDLNARQTTADFVIEFLKDALSYPQLQASTGIEVGDRLYPITHFASNLGTLQIPIVIVPHSQELDQPDTQFAPSFTNATFNSGNAAARKKSPFQLAQELLNASPEHQWAIVCNGKTLRLLRDAATLTRPSYLEVDLADILTGQRYSEFYYVWRLLHASRAGLIKNNELATESKPAVLIWEKWREEGQQEGVRVREGLREGVTSALQILGTGFLKNAANTKLRMALQNGEIKKEDYFAQLLRLVYRLIFLFSIEERGFLKNTDGKMNLAYAEGYSMARLRDMCLRRRASNQYTDHWQSTKIVFKGLDQGETRLGLPALGGLFNANQCIALDHAELSNQTWLEAIQNMRWTKKSGNGLALIDYRNMGVEELGSVYESLLELVPAIDVEARKFNFVGLDTEGSTSGNDRKLTGSYYTPDSLVQELIQSALVPVIEDRLKAQAHNPIQAILSIKVCDPACGSGHFLLAAARKLAERLATFRSVDEVVTPLAYRHALREVISTCIFGVDRNPMAIELARTALWLEGYEEGKPLSFLDHHLQVGDALLGLLDLKALEKGIPKAAFKPLSGDDKLVCTELGNKNTLAIKQMQKDLTSTQINLEFENDSSLQTLKAIEAMPIETSAQVAAKETAYHAFLLKNKNSQYAQAADLYMAAFLSPKTASTLELTPTTHQLYLKLNSNEENSIEAPVMSYATELCKKAYVFHWQLAFNQVFAAGGFDCVLGNPPWEMLQADPQEYFATRSPKIANAQHMTARNKLITELEFYDPILFNDYWSNVRNTEASQTFIHSSDRFPTSGFGRLNLAYLFAELFLDLKNTTGRSALVVPSGIATDSFSQHLFNKIADSNLVSLFDIENREKIFEAVDSRMKFSLLTLGQTTKSDFVCYVTNVNQIRDERRRFQLNKDDFSLLNPNTKTCSLFRSNQDAELTKKIYKNCPVLWREATSESAEQNEWGLKFMLMFMMNTDSNKFKNIHSQTTFPLFEAKLIHQFDHRWATYTNDGASRDMTLEEKQDPYKTVTPRYWIEKREVWLKVARLPQILLKALAEKNKETTLLGLTWLLFGNYLNQNPHQNKSVYSAWLEFVQIYPYAQIITPTALGFCSKNSPSLQAMDNNHLPAVNSFELVDNNPRSKPLWYAVIPLALDTYISQTKGYEQLLSSAPHLAETEQALAFAEELLENASPKWLMGWRDICRATDERTVISAVIPLAGVGHKMPLIFLNNNLQPLYGAVLYANFNSLVLDYLARQKVGGTSLTYFYLKQLPVLPPSNYTKNDLDYICQRILELTYTSHDLGPWAKDLGYEGPPFAFNPERRALLRAELDAYYARLYGLNKEELKYILDPSETMGADYPSETFRVLKNREMREFNEYRTQRLVLQAWDNLENIVIN